MRDFAILLTNYSALIRAAFLAHNLYSIRFVVILHIHVLTFSVRLYLNKCANLDYLVKAECASLRDACANSIIVSYW